MSDRDQFTRDPEADRPFREAFAHRLPPEIRRELEERAREAYHAALEDDAPCAFPDPSDVRGRLRAAAMDLRETAELLAATWREHRESELDTVDTVLSLLAGPRALEVQAVAERVEELVLFEPTLARPFSPGLAEAVSVPRAYLRVPIE